MNRYNAEYETVEKRCSKCGEWWPATTEFFHKSKCKSGLNSWCRACCLEDKATKYKEKHSAGVLTCS